MSILKQAVGFTRKGSQCDRLRLRSAFPGRKADVTLARVGAGLIVSSDNTAATEANISNRNRVQELLGDQIGGPHEEATLCYRRPTRKFWPLLGQCVLCCAAPYWPDRQKRHSMEP